MSDRVIRVGVVGCGQIAQTMHLPHLKRIHCNWLNFTTDTLRTFVAQHPRLWEIAIPPKEAINRSWDKISLQNAAGDYVTI